MNTNKIKGFTLVEVIVVLVILAILAAIIVPAMTGWIDKAKQGNAIAEAHECLIAGEYIAVERYAVGEHYNLAADKDETMKLAEVPAATDIVAFNFSTVATPTYLHVLASNGMNVVWQNGAFSVSESGGMSDKAVLSQVYSTLKAWQNPDGKIYSLGGTAPQKLVDMLSDAGVDPTKLGATTWSIRYNQAGGYPKIWWTEENLTGKTKAWVMAYSFEQYDGNGKLTQGGNYTVYSANVKNGVITGEYGQPVEGTVTEQTYDKAHALYLTQIAGGDPK